jgi:hypothetical protein
LGRSRAPSSTPTTTPTTGARWRERRPPGFIRSGLMNLGISFRHNAKAHHLADNYTYNYYLQLRRLSFATSGQLLRWEGLGIDPASRRQLLRRRRRKARGKRKGYVWKPWPITYPLASYTDRWASASVALQFTDQLSRQPRSLARDQPVPPP